MRGLFPNPLNERKGHLDGHIQECWSMFHFLILAVLGSIFMGLATPTEAAGVGAAGSVLRQHRVVLVEIVVRQERCEPRLRPTPIYIFNEPIPGPEPHPTIFARDQRWKLYNDGRLYDISEDALEQHPLKEGGEEARIRLQAVLDSMPPEGLKIYRPKTDPMANRG